MRPDNLNGTKVGGVESFKPTAVKTRELAFFQ